MNATKANNFPNTGAPMRAAVRLWICSVSPEPGGAGGPEVATASRPRGDTPHAAQVPASPVPLSENNCPCLNYSLVNSLRRHWERHVHGTKARGAAEPARTPQPVCPLWAPRLKGTGRPIVSPGISQAAESRETLGTGSTRYF